MKDFLATFAVVLILLFFFLFFGGLYLFSNIWGILILVSFIISIVITGFLQQESQIGKLEKRIQELETKQGIE